MNTILFLTILFFLIFITFLLIVIALLLQKQESKITTIELNKEEFNEIGNKFENLINKFENLINDYKEGGIVK